MPPTTIRQLLQQARKRIDPLDAELLLAFVLKKPREFVFAHGEQKVLKCSGAKVLQLVRRRAAGVPLAYLTGRKEFFGLDFVVDKRVLIPRPETETLVEEVISFIIHHLSYNIEHGTWNKRIVLVDVGTGSGCIPIAITSALKHLSTSAPKIFAIDVSQAALRIAKLNAKKHGVKIKFLHGNLLTPLVNNLTIQQFNNSTLIITANLPYLTNQQYGRKPSHKYEPRQALLAGKTGLELYAQLLRQIEQIKNYKLKIINFFEMDPSQSHRIVQLIKKHLPNAEIEIKKDLADLDRVMVVSETAQNCSSL